MVYHIDGTIPLSRIRLVSLDEVQRYLLPDAPDESHALTPAQFNVVVTEARKIYESQDVTFGEAVSGLRSRFLFLKTHMKDFSMIPALIGIREDPEAFEFAQMLVRAQRYLDIFADGNGGHGVHIRLKTH